MSNFDIKDIYGTEDKINITLACVKKIVDTTAIVKQSCNVAVETIDDLLTFDKIDENKLVLETELINPEIFIEDVIKPFEINANVAEVQLVFKKNHFSDYHLSHSLAMKGDKFKMNQVLRNLISNSIKFTPVGGKVTVSTEIVPNNKNFGSSENLVRISVQDTGCGISKENLPKLFGQYVQFNARELQKGGGSGLGLWISKSNICQL
jgi:signal transduction histidine kinase